MSEENNVPAPETEAPPSGEQKPAPGDYHARIQSEPEFAVGEVQKKDSYISKLRSELKQYEALKPLVEAGVPATQIVELANVGYLTQQNQQNQKTQSAPVERDETDDILDPELRQVLDLVKKQEGVISELRQRLNVTETNSVKGTLQENIGSALNVFSRFPEHMERAKEIIMSAVEISEKQARAGNEQAQRNLNALAGPQGVQTLRMMVQSVYDEVFESLQNSNTPPADGGPTKHATDQPSNTRSAPPTPELAVDPGRRVNAQLMREVLEKATKAAGKDPASFWS